MFQPVTQMWHLPASCLFSSASLRSRRLKISLVFWMTGHLWKGGQLKVKWPRQLHQNILGETNRSRMGTRPFPQQLVCVTQPWNEAYQEIKAVWHGAHSCLCEGFEDHPPVGATQFSVKLLGVNTDLIELGLQLQVPQGKQFLSSMSLQHNFSGCLVTKRFALRLKKRSRRERGTAKIPCTSVIYT